MSNKHKEYTGNSRALKVQRPILRYHGGKFLLADWIISHFPEHDVYTETFGGAGSVLLKKNRAYAEVYNDLDGEVVNLFKMVRDRGDELRERISLTPFSRTEFVKSFRLVRNPMERARRTVIRSFMGFGSGISFNSTGFRANSNRSGTTPAQDWCNLPDAYAAIVERLKGVIIENRDWYKVAMQHDNSKTLHFFDPPYVLDTRFLGQKTSIYKYEMSNGQHEDFCCKVLSLKECQSSQHMTMTFTMNYFQDSGKFNVRHMQMVPRRGWKHFSLVLILRKSRDPFLI